MRWYGRPATVGFSKQRWHALAVFAVQGPPVFPCWQPVDPSARDTVVKWAKRREVGYGPGAFQFYSQIEGCCRLVRIPLANRLAARRVLGSRGFFPFPLQGGDPACSLKLRL